MERKRKEEVDSGEVASRDAPLHYSTRTVSLVCIVGTYLLETKTTYNPKSSRTSSPLSQASMACRNTQNRSSSVNVGKSGLT